MQENRKVLDAAGRRELLDKAQQIYDGGYGHVLDGLIEILCRHVQKSETAEPKRSPKSS